MNFFNTFRGKLLVILAILLIVTLGLQYYLNLKTQRENNNLREMQTQALVAGIALGINGVTSKDRIGDIVEAEGQTFFDERTTERIRDIIVVDKDWQIYDSLNKEYLPSEDESGQTVYKKLSELRDLPPVMEADRLGEDRYRFPNAAGSSGGETRAAKVDANQAQNSTNENAQNTPRESSGNNSAATDSNRNADRQNVKAGENGGKNGETHVVPIDTNQGRYYVMVILKNEKTEAVSRAARPLVYTLLILLLSTLITIFLVWRFTRPIANLSNAARRIAEGDLSYRVAGAERNDEMGTLAAQFNEMTAELEKTRELEAQLQQAEKSAVVGRLGSAIAHEIRNPLNYINLSLDHLRAKFAPEDAEKKADFEKLTAQLKTEVARINGQITDFLSYSRPAKADLKPLDARRVVEDSLRIVEAQASEQNIKISLVERESVPQILGDAEFLRSVFNNLFINAVQSMENAGGILNVKISPENQFVRIEIEDTGKGIGEEHFAKIFEPYFSTKETGTGLGLAIVQKVVDVHSGTVEVESRLNAGTKFIVKLPKAGN